MPSLVALCGERRQKNFPIFIHFFKEVHDNICISEVICFLIVTNNALRGGTDAVVSVGDT